MNDNENPMGLLSRFRGSHEFKQALEQSRPRLYRVAYAWTHQSALADDLVQETLTKAWQNGAQLRDLQSQEAWLFSILANCYRDHFRRYREMEDIDELELPVDVSPESENIQNETVRKVRQAIAKLPEGQRQVVTLVDIEGFSYVEVAQILAIPSGTVMSRLSRARTALKDMLLTDFQTNHTGQGTIRRVK